MIIDNAPFYIGIYLVLLESFVSLSDVGDVGVKVGITIIQNVGLALLTFYYQSSVIYNNEHLFGCLKNKKTDIRRCELHWRLMFTFSLATGSINCEVTYQTHTAVLGTKQYQFRCFQNCRFQEVIASKYLPKYFDRFVLLLSYL